MVFPILILAVTVLISIFQFFYQLTEIRVEMHKALRAESGKLCGTMEYHKEPELSFPVYRKGGKLYCYGTLKSGEKWFLDRQEKNLMSEKYLDDEKKIVRMVDFIKKGETSYAK